MTLLDRLHTRRSLLSRLGSAAALSMPLGRFLLRAQSNLPASRTFDPKRYGAKGDGLALDTAPIQRAIDLAAQAGGGMVSLSAGHYVTGTLHLKSGVTLSLSQDASLLGSLDPADYPLVEPFTDAVGAARGYALIACVDARNAGIQGPGTIDGRGPALVAAAGPSGAKSPAARPFLVLCVRSSAVVLDGVRLLNSAAWTTHIFQCSNVSLRHVLIRSLGLPNNDGIDIDSSSEVRIDSCTIESGDDAICLKTTSSQPCHDIFIANCTMTTRCAAFKIGTESAADFSAITVRDCHVVQANLGAIKILSVDGARISGVLVERITVDDADTPIFLRLGERGRTFRAGDTSRPAGSISGIVLRDINVKSARRIGILLSGIPGYVIEEVTLDRITIALSGPAVTQPPPEPPESPSAYPEVRMFGANLPAFGLYGRHVRNVHASDVKISAAPGETRPESLLLGE